MRKKANKIAKIIVLITILFILSLIFSILLKHLLLKIILSDLLKQKFMRKMFFLGIHIQKPNVMKKIIARIIFLYAKMKNRFQKHQYRAQQFNFLKTGKILEHKSKEKKVVDRNYSLFYLFIKMLRRFLFLSYPQNFSSFH